MKNYLIVGGSSGIGKALMESLVDKGHNVYVTYCNNPVQLSAPNLKCFQYDVLSDSLDHSAFPDYFDGLVYCPGSINLKPFHRLKPNDFVEDYQLQVVGAITTIQSVLPLLKKADQASIVLFSTVAVQSGFNFHSQVSASKGAIEGLMRALAAEFAPKIRVNAIAPSITNTPLAGRLLNSEDKVIANGQRHPLKRVGEAMDIAKAAEYLLTEDSSWVSGQVLKVDGGMSTLKV